VINFRSQGFLKKYLVHFMNDCWFQLSCLQVEQSASFFKNNIDCPFEASYNLPCLLNNKKNLPMDNNDFDLDLDFETTSPQLSTHNGSDPLLDLDIEKGIDELADELCATETLSVDSIDCELDTLTAFVDDSFTGNPYELDSDFAGIENNIFSDIDELDLIDSSDLLS